MRHAIKTTKFAEKQHRDILKRILLRDLSKIRNKTVLEIGCGKWDYAKKILEKAKCSWTGLEPIDFKDENLTQINGSVDKLPFHDNSFDLVLCNQTIEHWFEYGVSFNEALREINRVLKYKGGLMVNTGVHIHGHPYFLRGDLKRISKLFKKGLWKITLFERCVPSYKLKAWKRLGMKGWQSKVGYPDFLIPNSGSAYAYLLNIHAVKIGKAQETSYRDNRGIFGQAVVILRFLKELLLYYL